MIKIDRDWYTVDDALEATASALMPVPETGGHRLLAHDGTPVHFRTAEEALHASIKGMHWLTLGQLVRSGEVTLRAPLSRSPVEWEPYWGMRDVEGHLLSSADFAVLCNRLAIAPSDIDDAGDQVPASTEAAVVDMSDWITAGEVAQYFDGIHFSAEQWSRNFRSGKTKWILNCNVAPGTPGRNATPAMWSALALAKAVSLRPARARDLKRVLDKLSAMFGRVDKLKPLLDDWTEYRSVNFD